MSPTTREGAEGRRLILTLSCPDRIGIVAAVANCCSRTSATSSKAPSSATRKPAFLHARVLRRSRQAVAWRKLQRAFAPVAERFGMQWHLHDVAVKPRVLIMVSKFGHCLNDLLYPLSDRRTASRDPRDRFESSRLLSARRIARHPVSSPARRSVQQDAQEERLLELIEGERCDLVVLARYMQILSSRAVRAPERARHQHPPFVPAELSGRAALPAGARSRRQADRRHRSLRDRGSGRGSDHRAGRDACRSRDERRGLRRCRARHRSPVLARAVTWHVEHRILLNGHRTVIFK